MDRTKIIACLALALAGCGAKAHTIRVASKDFTEQVVLGEIVAQHLENRLHRKIARSLNLGGTLLVQSALINREIDVYPEYSGTALTMVLKENASGDAGGVLARVRSEYSKKFHLAWLDPLGIDNGFAMVVRGADARAKGLKTLSDAVRLSWTLGVGYEFERRADGMAAVKSVYALQLKGSPITMNLGLLYQAIEQKQVDMIAASATDGMLSKMDLQILEDDRHAFPPYQVSLVAREEMLKEMPEMRAALEELSGKFTNAKMQELNYLVDVEHRAVGLVAEGFLKGAGLR
jgi:osmoprotectant transport system substrate-binding protein